MWLAFMNLCWILATQLPLCASIGVPSLSMYVKNPQDGTEYRTTFYFNTSVSILAAVRDYTAAHGLSKDQHILILEKLVEHAAAASQDRDVDNELFVRLRSRESALEKVESLTRGIMALPDDAFPARVWTTSTAPPFHIVLTGTDEYVANEIMSPFTAYSGGWLYKQSKFIINAARAAHSNKPGVVIDVGANLGMLSMYAAAMGEKIVAFEATSTTAHKLKSSCVLSGWCPAGEKAVEFNSFSANDRFAIYENAVSNVDGQEVSLRLNWQHLNNMPNAGSNSMFFVGDEAEGSCQFETKISITLDSALASHGLVPRMGEQDRFFPRGYISILKMVCEGCEPNALLGASLLFKYNPPMTIIVEVNKDRLAAAGSSAYEFLSQIEQLGYLTIVNLKYGTSLSPITRVAIEMALEDDNIDCLCLLKA